MHFACGAGSGASDHPSLSLSPMGDWGGFDLTLFLPTSTQRPSAAHQQQSFRSRCRHASLGHSHTSSGSFPSWAPDRSCLPLPLRGRAPLPSRPSTRSSEPAGRPLRESNPPTPQVADLCPICGALRATAHRYLRASSHSTPRASCACSSLSAPLDGATSAHTLRHAVRFPTTPFFGRLSGESPLAAYPRAPANTRVPFIRTASPTFRVSLSSVRSA